MGDIYLFAGRPGLQNWYGIRPQKVKSVFKKNLFFFERTYDVKTRDLRVGRGRFHILVEGKAEQVEKLCHHLLRQVNRQLLGGAKGIFVFSGGLELRKVQELRDEIIDDDDFSTYRHGPRLLDVE